MVIGNNMPKKSTKIVTVAEKEVAIPISQLTPDQIDLIKRTVAVNASDDELKLFLYTANRTGLDPLTRQIFFVSRWNEKLRKNVGTIQTGIDGYRAIAERTGNLAGIDDAIYEEGATGMPTKATVTVYRMVKGLKVSFTASARWNEYVPKVNQGFMWQKMPFLMLGKVAEALALRKAFPLNLSGIYTNEEMEQAAQPIDTSPIKVKATEVENPTKLKLKNSIYQNLLILVPDVKPNNVHEWTKTLTGLELEERNYTEIDARLAFLVIEKDENQEDEDDEQISEASP